MFTDAERKVYVAPDGRRLDPLNVSNQLRQAAGGRPRFNAWLDALDHLADLNGRSNVPIDDLSQADLEAAKAEEGLVRAARHAFAFDPNKTLDAEVLETLWHFLTYLEGKGSPAASGPTSRPAMADSADYRFGMFPEKSATNSSSGSS